MTCGCSLEQRKPQSRCITLRNVILPDKHWSHEDTDYLLDLCDLFRLRFIHNADRWQVCDLPH